MKEICSVFRKLQSAGTIVFLLFLLLAGAGPAMAQLSPVTGVVYDPDGNPLEGVTVVVEKTARGTVTDRDGKFLLQAQPGEVLIFHMMGSLEQRVGYTGQTNIEVTMSVDVAAIEEIVVVGYGQVKRGSVTGAIGQIKGDQLLKGPLTNVSSMLSSYTGGMSSIQQSGQPGADQASIKIRGSSVGAQYIVDGIPRDISYLDPNEIESISVLKDAAAAAVYGLEAQGGVVIVTTKQGKTGKPKITYRASLGASMNTNYPEFLDGPGYAYWYNKALELDGADPIFTSEHVARMTNGDASDGWGNTNWFKEVFGVGFNQQHNINVNGGNDNASYFASLGYFNQKGNIENFDFDRYNLRLNLDTKISRNLTFILGVAGQVADRKAAGYDAGGTAGSDVSSAAWLSIAEQAAFAHPYIPMYYTAP